MTNRNIVIVICTPCTVVFRSSLMSLIMTFMLEPAKLQMNCASASGTSARRRFTTGAAGEALMTVLLVQSQHRWAGCRWRPECRITGAVGRLVPVRRLLHLQPRKDRARRLSGALRADAFRGPGQERREVVADVAARVQK